MGVVLLEIPAQILYLSSARSTNRVVPTTTKFSLSLKPNPAKWPPPIAFRYKVSIRGGPPPSIELTSNRGREKNLVHANSLPLPQAPSSGSFRMKFPIIAFRETWRLPTLRARFSPEETIIKVIELVTAVIFHPLNPLPATVNENLYKAWSTREGERCIYTSETRQVIRMVGWATPTSFAENIARSG